MPKSRLHQLASFIRVFGFAAGTRIWIQLLWQSIGSPKLIHLNIPGLSAPITLRPADLPIFWQILVMRENDFQSLPQAKRINDFYKQTLKEGVHPVIVDCGGHIGLSALFFATSFKEATIYTVEPDEANFNLLVQNTRPYTNIVPLRGGVWGRDCALQISNPASGSASFVLKEVSSSKEQDSHNTSLPSYTIEKIVGQAQNQRLLLVKIDIEGAESAVFEGPSEWLTSTAVLIIELHDWLFPWKGTSRNFFKRLGERDFDVVIRGENLLLFQP